MPQLVTRVDDELLRQVDSLIADGTSESRSDAVRDALALWIRHSKREAQNARTVAAYTAQPQTNDEIGWSDEAAIQMIETEPW
jgi:Arc/MetJ-type ribon-helix-helix transcriptional regulator